MTEPTPPAESSPSTATTAGTALAGPVHGPHPDREQALEARLERLETKQDTIIRSLATLAEGLRNVGESLQQVVGNQVALGKRLLMTRLNLMQLSEGKHITLSATEDIELAESDKPADQRDPRITVLPERLVVEGQNPLLSQLTTTIQGMQQQLNTLAEAVGSSAGAQTAAPQPEPQHKPQQRLHTSWLDMSLRDMWNGMKFWERQPSTSPAF